MQRVSLYYVIFTRQSATFYPAEKPVRHGVGTTASHEKERPQGRSTSDR